MVWSLLSWNPFKRHLSEEELINKTSDTMKKYHLKGRVVLVDQHRNINLSIGIGLADFTNQIRNDNPAVVYPSASLQKSMTAAMMVQLINESQGSGQPLSQFTTIETWFPNLIGAETISLGNLLTQTSGIRDSDHEVDLGTTLSEDAAISATITRINKVGLKSKVFNYNNDNFILLAGIIRQITGDSYANNLQKRIIEPLELKHSFMWHAVPDNFIKSRSYEAISNDYQNETAVSDSLVSTIVGAGNMFTTPEDYYQFQIGLVNGKILNTADYGYLAHLESKSVTGYAGGFYFRNRNHVKNVYGSLVDNHFGNWMQMSSDNQKGIILFVNQTSVIKNGSRGDTIKQAGIEILRNL
ncbi:serine hydrolase domain-containing protein [Pediococcus argentinicus]|uniref:Penicillin-binding protein n=1 Tax=Pediococcus argentinicus TaxID=480391 RepID=A0A0R2NBS8_9LACO|nr:serine hydrolase domain-containing protein [Pediococcus argentinicus]KRO22258.1 penicillin-binding protein [Pediococcus argentinicus]NKZ23074.1 beta-lactamase family protein [Pediococcus argentinicus]GEP20165.1 penicillin-binding protein [Pediococcus argentinicus]